MSQIKKVDCDGEKASLTKGPSKKSNKKVFLSSTSEIIPFLLIDDSQIGLDISWVQDCIVRSSESDDEDVQSDEEQIAKGVKSIKTDLDVAVNYLKIDGWKRFIKNTSIASRIQFPDLHDSNGRPKRN